MATCPRKLKRKHGEETLSKDIRKPLKIREGSGRRQDRRRYRPAKVLTVSCESADGGRQAD